MKIKTEVTIDIGQFENIKPQIEIDTENVNEAKELLKFLWQNFHGFTRTIEDKVNELAQLARNGKPIPIEEFEKVSYDGGSGIPNNPTINEAKKAYNRDQYAANVENRKATLVHKVYKSDDKLQM